MKLFDSNLRKCVEYELDLKDSVRLKRIRANGVYDKIYAKWFGTK